MVVEGITGLLVKIGFAPVFDYCGKDYENAIVPQRLELNGCRPPDTS
jgi:hypothetical protein